MVIEEWIDAGESASTAAAATITAAVPANSSQSSDTRGPPLRVDNSRRFSARIAKRRAPTDCSGAEHRRGRPAAAPAATPSRRAQRRDS